MAANIPQYLWEIDIYNSEIHVVLFTSIFIVNPTL
ncbi:hypothetical protein PPTG_22245 [Phytophthora nicotianae INRA-310]|uniref:Uncharacterized protein n=3 Tax=Phytophthora nicotianae TaxID=4792 RepID=W2QN09_PHYN3|nr:hypothetical protein PPTG_22245 [Phytophthora nicotianae INRA-310]ETI53551.1 hypothetical protein F443_03535 [Phytophthora nicotianae P1569]ETM53095.1 hypothetical protein L914_03397 [Phytophthora nicotianae]ETN13635.1 hypothetical protein PPTG_22245 [Phytophthora nicotianae INRA-310]